VKIQVQVFCVVTPCSVTVGYRHFRGHLSVLPQHYMESQPRRFRLKEGKEDVPFEECEPVRYRMTELLCAVTL
jgi:hypothetical protein